MNEGPLRGPSLRELTVVPPNRGLRSGNSRASGWTR